MSINSSSTTISKNLKRKPPPPPPPPPEISTDVDLSFNDVSFNSFDSPKPKGPKEIWEYETTPNKKHPGYPIESELPYPTKPIEDIINSDDEIDMIFNYNDSQIKSIEVSPSQNRTILNSEDTIYNDSIQFKINSSPTHDSINSYSPSQIRTKEIINQTINSTSPIIPTLSNRSSLPNLYTYSPSSSPTKRSPSPRRPNHLRDASMGSNEISFEIFERNTSRWNSLQSKKSTYQIVTDNPFYEVEEFEKRVESPATEYFDYSTLPELPRNHKELPPTPLDLPQLPFDSNSLTISHFEACEKIWSLSSLFSWCLKLKIWLNDSNINKNELKRAITRLIAFHRNDISLDMITKNSNIIIESLMNSGAIGIIDDLVIFHHVYVNGILPELTPCYSTIPHVDSVCCYSNICHFSKQLNLERIMRNMKIEDVHLENDWANHWHLTVENLRSLNPSLIKQQSYIFDLLRYEQTFIERAKCWVEIVAPDFIKAGKSLSISKIKIFEDDVVSLGSKIVEIHQNSLFHPLLKILISEGKFIKNLSEIADIYTNWAIEIREYLVGFMKNMPLIEDLLKMTELKSYVDNHISQIPKVKELKVNVGILFISTFNSRYQQIPLQLLEIRKKYKPEEFEYVALTNTIDEIKSLGSRINEIKKSADSAHALEIIKHQIIWKSNIRQINLNLNSANRKFICRGDLNRRSDLKFTNSINHVILLDNYLLITEKSKTKNGIFYKIIEDPIPIDFVIIEDKIGNIKSSPPSPSTEEIEEPDQDYQFKVRYAGRSKKNSFTFGTKSEREKYDWINFIKLAKESLSKKTKPSNPYKVQLISNTCFGYEFNNRILKLQILDQFDPIYQLCLDSQEKLNKLGILDSIYANSRNRIVFSRVLCMNSFDYLGSKFTLIGLSNGLYMCESKSHWKKIMNGSDFTKIYTDTNLNLIITLNDKQLKYYPIYQFINVYYEKDSNITSILLSNESVSFFSMSKHKNITMLFYAKRKTNSTVTHFKVLIPETDNNGIFSRFKDEKKFYIEAECYGISIFNSSFTVFTNKGFEVLELDKLIPRTVPDLPTEIVHSPDQSYSKKANTVIETIKKLISSSNVKPLGMFKLNNNTEFLLVYNEFAIFINKHGKLSRSSILIFEFKVKYTKFTNNHLFIINDECVEVLSISDFVKGSNKLIQVVTGKDIRLINGGDNEVVSIAMANPTVCGLQLVFNLVSKK
ncbi:unnamed protein product [Candida verbasci]|uniref:Rho1 guanine nucleotide exchange factor TUS1 n=1 Tax=Candida verbasci TaxID=1227364 RepID=A0A9W4X9V9_9ASCO|nr:unnamed protein product [Candida verbasci]